MNNKTKLTPKLMTEFGFWQGGYTSIWYHGEHGVIDDNIDEAYEMMYGNI